MKTTSEKFFFLIIYIVDFPVPFLLSSIVNVGKKPNEGFKTSMINVCQLVSSNEFAYCKLSSNLFQMMLRL